MFFLADQPYEPWQFLYLIIIILTTSILVAAHTNDVFRKNGYIPRDFMVIITAIGMMLLFLPHIAYVLFLSLFSIMVKLGAPTSAIVISVLFLLLSYITLLLALFPPIPKSSE